MSQHIKNIKEFGLAIAKLRKSAKLSQQDLAQKADLTQSTVSDFENGIRGNMNTMFKLLTALDAELIIADRKEGAKKGESELLKLLGGKAFYDNR